MANAEANACACDTFVAATEADICMGPGSRLGIPTKIKGFWLFATSLALPSSQICGCALYSSAIMPSLMYNPDQESVRFLFRWNHTLLPMVVSDPLFWFLITGHVALLLRQRALLEAGEEGFPPLEWSAALVPTSLLTFFVVFYVSNCYDRFFQLFGCCVGLSGCVAEWAYLIRVYFSGHSAELRWNMMRVILGAMQVHFAFVAGEDDDKGFKCITEAEWDRIARYGFLTHEEIRQVATCSNGSRFFLPVTWGLKEVKRLTRLPPNPCRLLHMFSALCFCCRCTGARHAPPKAELAQGKAAEE